MEESIGPEPSPRKRAAFVAVPWADTLRGNDEFKIPGVWISLYPVVAMFEGANGCFLSQDKLAAYAGMRKEEVAPALEAMEKSKWLARSLFRGRRAWSPTSHYGDSRRSAENWFIIGRELIAKGVWSVMGRTRQTIYSIIKSWCGHPALALDRPEMIHSEPEIVEYEIMEVEVECGGRTHSAIDCDFLRLENYEPELVREVARKSLDKCDSKTLTRAMKWYQDEGLMTYLSEYECFVFPRAPGRYAQGFRERLEKINQAQKAHAVSYAAKRAAWAAMRRTAKPGRTVADEPEGA